MLTIDQLKDLKDNRAQFQAVTGLTWDPAVLKDVDVEKIQWYFPKGAGFDKEHIAFDKELINSLGSGELKNPYYNVEEGGDEPTQDADVPQEEIIKTIENIDGKTDDELNDEGGSYGISADDIKDADANGDGVVEIVSTPVQEKEGKYMLDAEENYTTVYTVQDNDNVEDDSNI